MASVTNYTGTENLGLGSNPQIPVSPKTDYLGDLSKISQNLMMMDAERNMQLFNQKVKDRDVLLKLIDDNQVQSGNILPQYRADFDKQQKKAEEAYFAIKGINDLEGREKYNKETAALKDVANYAQFKTLNYYKDADELAKVKNPTIQKKMKENLEGNVSKPLFDAWGEYQQTFDLDIPAMNEFNLKGAFVPKTGMATPEVATTDRTTAKTVNGKTTVTETQTTAPVKGMKNVVPQQAGGQGALSPFSTVAGRRVDYKTILNNTSQGFLSTDEQQRYNQEQLRNQLETGDVRASMNIIDNINKRITDYNTQNGFDENNPDFVPKVNAFLDPQKGKVIVNEQLPDLAAKFSLANINGDYVEQDKTQFNKDIADYGLKKDELAEKKRQANMDDKTKRYIANISKKTTKSTGQILSEMGNALDSFGRYVLGSAGGDFVFNADGTVTKKDGTPYTGSIRINGNDVPDGIKNLIKGANKEYNFSDAASVRVKDGQVQVVQFDGSTPVSRGDISNYQIKDISTSTDKENPYIPNYGAGETINKKETVKSKGTDAYVETRVVNGVTWGRKADGTIEQIK